MTEFTVQCEICGDNVPESKAEMIHHTGYDGFATEAFCEQCQE